MVLSQNSSCSGTAFQTKDKKRKLLCCIKQGQFKLLGHVISKGELEDIALKGRIPGKRARGARRFTFVNNFKHLYQNAGQLWDADQNRTNWKKS